MTIRTSDHPIVYFDGVCGFCNATVDLLLRWDRQHRLRFAPLQGTTAEQRLTDEQRNLDSIVFQKADRVWMKSAAVVRILWELGGVWTILGSLLWIIPKPLRDLGYALLARVRYRLFGKKESCRMPTAAERELMLD